MTRTEFIARRMYLARVKSLPQEVQKFGKVKRFFDDLDPVTKKYVKGMGQIVEECITKLSNLSKDDMSTMITHALIQHIDPQLGWNEAPNDMRVEWKHVAEVGFGAFYESPSIESEDVGSNIIFEEMDPHVINPTELEIESPKSIPESCLDETVEGFEPTKSLSDENWNDKSQA